MYRVVNMCIGTRIHTHLVIMLPPRPKEYQKPNSSSDGKPLFMLLEEVKRLSK